MHAKATNNAAAIERTGLSSPDHAMITRSGPAAVETWPRGDLPLTANPGQSPSGDLVGDPRSLASALTLLPLRGIYVPEAIEDAEE